MQITSTQRKGIDQYYKELEAYHEHKVTHETAVRSAFQYLLATFAKSANWTLIPEQALEKCEDDPFFRVSRISWAKRCDKILIIKGTHFRGFSAIVKSHILEFIGESYRFR